MDRKHGKYVVNIEQSENQPSITCPNDQEVHSSACWRPLSSDITCDISSNSTGVCVGPGVLGHSGYPHTESAHTQVKGNCCCNWTLWNIFLACFLACVITTAIGVLIICLVNNRGNDNSSIVIKLSPNNGEPVTPIHGKTSAGPQPTVTTMSTEPTAVATSTDSTTISMSTESTATTSTVPTTSTRSTELTTTTAITPTSTKTSEAST
ncbi:dynactin-associated protein [Eptesicus fuscus]|uniref:dynactin-associated protein n=1 Tax=Eptesicus fuscus TaxID=29078 RepID=UPI002403A73E|nr:dynactin-associated protein [Eptesicus fuscus]